MKKSVVMSCGVFPFSAALLCLGLGPVQDVKLLQVSRAKPAASPDMLTVDFNGDQRPDLLYVEPKGQIFLFENQGENGFQDVSARVGLPQGLGEIRSIALLDLNRDVRPEIVIEHASGQNLAFEYSAKKDFFEDISNRVGLDRITGSIQWSDANGDEYPDAFVFNSTGGVVLFQNESGEKFADPVSVVLSSTTSTSTSENEPDSGANSNSGSGNSNTVIGSDIGMSAPSAGPQGTTGTPIPGGSGVIPGNTQSLVGCTATSAPSLIDMAGTGQCIDASSVPTLGKLFPIDSRLFVANNGNVGLGTTNPREHLQIGSQFSFHDGGSKVLGFNSYWTSGIGWRRLSAGFAGRIGMSVVGSGDGAMRFFLHPNGSADSVCSEVEERLTILSNGRVGINNAAPSAPLDINGSLVVRTNGPGYQSLFRHNDTYLWIQPVNQSDSAGYVEIGAWDNLGSNTGSRPLAISASNLGVGTTAPDSRLSVIGNISIPYGNEIRLNSGPNRTLLKTDWLNGKDCTQIFTPGTVSGTPKLTLTSAGQVGVNTTNPRESFQIGDQLVYHDGGWKGLVFNGYYSNGWLRQVSGASAGFFFEPNTGTLRFLAAPSGAANTTASLTEKMVILENGNVGIGTATPTAKLQVNGVTRTNVLEITGGADLAEPFDVHGTDEVEPGMVLTIDPENEGKLRLANTSYDRTVAGVVSGAGGVNPGMTLSQKGKLDGEHPVALTGRVYCWVDASYGAIQAGDLLTTSDTPGHAMKVSDHSRANGAILGKALSSLKSGKGLVLIVVALQ